MSLMYSPIMVLMMSTLTLSTLMAISSANWILLWVAMELNLLSFIPILMQTKNHQEVEGSVKYFLAQALGSALLLISSTSMWMPFSSTQIYLPLLLSTSLLLKLGSVPCHFWYPSVMNSISWTSCLILSTWQKLAPISILAFLLVQKSMLFIVLAAGLNALLGGIMGMNQSQMRTIMAYSSIGHIGWMLSLIVILKPTASILYFIVYSMLITPLFMAMNYFNTQHVKHFNSTSSNNIILYTLLATLLMSLGGLPPLTGFMPKLMTLIMLMETMKLLALLLILGSVMNLFFYLSIVINAMFLTPQLKDWLPLNKGTPSNLIVMLSTLSLGLAPLIMI
uniref:NADH dehydrogenase subunit 2 n=1 Tax=Eisenia nordenskioldi TaxID=538895 RepID=UPI0021B5C29D|nr:NADH dehydrogenase subunit 2 [Eisenia nordenskioldi]UIX22964.1 NADH dehydrogenase subunit 2 [Eisenia nordenskioldi]UIX22977.1 NADH dehydrogenase subunit 2 [Eisenia nordenskioldi]